MTATPCLKVLIIDHNKPRLITTQQYLQSVVSVLDRSDLSLEFLAVNSESAAVTELDNDGDIQAVLLSWETLGDSLRDSSIIDAIKSRRLEVPVYVTGENEVGFDIVSRSSKIEAFFALHDIA